MLPMSYSKECDLVKRKYKVWILRLLGLNYLHLIWAMMQCPKTGSNMHSKFLKYFGLKVKVCTKQLIVNMKWGIARQESSLHCASTSSNFSGVNSNTKQWACVRAGQKLFTISSTYVNWNVLTLATPKKRITTIFIGLQCSVLHFGAYDYCTHIDQHNVPRLSPKLYFIGEILLL